MLLLEQKYWLRTNLLKRKKRDSAPRPCENIALVAFYVFFPLPTPKSKTYIIKSFFFHFFSRGQPNLMQAFPLFSGNLCRKSQTQNIPVVMNGRFTGEGVQVLCILKCHSVFGDAKHTNTRTRTESMCVCLCDFHGRFSSHSRTCRIH